VAADVRELRFAQAVEDHKAWLSVDLMQSADPEANHSHLPQIAKLIAELAGPDCLAIYHPETHKINVWDSSLEDKLRGRNPLQDFASSAFVPVTEVEGEDPRIGTCAGSRRRWPELWRFHQAGWHPILSSKPLSQSMTPLNYLDSSDRTGTGYIYELLGMNPWNCEAEDGDPMEIPVKD